MWLDKVANDWIQYILNWDTKWRRRRRVKENKKNGIPVVCIKMEIGKTDQNWNNGNNETMMKNGNNAIKCII